MLVALRHRLLLSSLLLGLTACPGVEDPVAAPEPVGALARPPASGPARPAAPSAAATVGAGTDSEAAWARQLGTAQFIGEARVLQVTAREGTLGRAGQPVIWSEVQLEAGRVLRDRTGLARSGRFSLRFLGGAIGRRGMGVAGGPRLGGGERLILFTGDEPGPWPTVGGAAGLWRIEQGRVLDLGGRPLRALSHAGPHFAPLAQAAAAVAATGARAAQQPPAPQPLGEAEGRVLTWRAGLDAASAATAADGAADGAAEGLSAGETLDRLARLLAEAGR